MTIVNVMKIPNQIQIGLENFDDRCQRHDSLTLYRHENIEK